MICILMGAPGAGKGTQGDLMVKHFGFTKLSTGDVLRAEIKAQSPIGKIAKDIVESGRLVPDDVLLKIIEKNLKDHEGKRLLLDGYPRNKNQAKDLDQLGLKISAVIFFEVSKDSLVERLCGRRVCSSCGANYHVSALPKGGKCENCQGELMQRADDTKEKVQTRLDIYDRETAPVCDYYIQTGVARKIDGNQDPQKVFEDLTKIVDSLV